mmetsp:Transcript_5832/g.12865  ORF Transcript_5832/g.12865 Transcript_5832/m.12865 type:complete len:221 (-) Transcript_5832:2174-2836(-)
MCPRRPHLVTSSAGLNHLASEGWWNRCFTTANFLRTRMGKPVRIIFFSVILSGSTLMRLPVATSSQPAPLPLLSSHTPATLPPPRPRPRPAVACVASSGRGAGPALRNTSRGVAGTQTGPKTEATQNRSGSRKRSNLCLSQLRLLSEKAGRPMKERKPATKSSSSLDLMVSTQAECLVSPKCSTDSFCSCRYRPQQSKKPLPASRPATAMGTFSSSRHTN